jgi:hypothetical protein
MVARFYKHPLVSAHHYENCRGRSASCRNAIRALATTVGGGDRNQRASALSGILSGARHQLEGAVPKSGVTSACGATPGEILLFCRT